MAARLRTVFAQPTPEQAREQWRRVADGCRERWLRLAERMDAAEVAVLPYLAFPPAHWRQAWSAKPLERPNKEIMRRTDVVGIFPNPAAAVRPVGALLAEQHDEWAVGRRSFSAESLALLRPGSSPPPALARTAWTYTLDGTPTRACAPRRRARGNMSSARPSWPHGAK